MTRKMATIRVIDELRPIPDADAIECAVIGGWTVVVKKGDYQAGQKAIYCEIDSWIPTKIAPFLTHKDKFPREYEGIKGERLRTVKLRGQLSQGLLLPLSINDSQFDYVEGYDVSEILGILKYDPPVSAQLAGTAKGNFPSFIPKTDQERIQNLKRDLANWTAEGDNWEVSEKLDGSSMTVYFNEDTFGVCSRNLDLRENDDNTFWKVARVIGLEAILREGGINIALQGELIGEGVQGNPYKIHGHQFRIYDIYLIDEKRYMTPTERSDYVTARELLHVPLVSVWRIGFTMMELLEMAEGKSHLNGNTEREGLVWKRYDGAASFKVISNKFLLKEKN